MAKRERYDPNDWDPPLFNNADFDNPMSNPRLEDISDEILAEMPEEQIEEIRRYWEMLENRPDIWGEDEGE
jgi:hypothetical protein